MTATEAWAGAAEDIRRAATRRGRVSVGCCVVEGRRLFERALRAGVRIESALIAENCLPDPDARTRRLVEQLRDSAGGVHVVPADLVHELTEGRGSGGLVGLVGLPTVPPLGELLKRSPLPTPVLLVGCDIEDPGNVGALTRTALATGAAALVGVGISDPWHPKSVRTSRGSVFKLPLPSFATVAELLPELRELGVRTLGAVASGGSPLPRTRFDRRPVAIFLGSEAFGLPGGLAEALDGLVSAPMIPGVDSYSINAVAAVLLYEFARQTQHSS